jgi:hypothetical protein
MYTWTATSAEKITGNWPIANYTFSSARIEDVVSYLNIDGTGNMFFEVRACLSA